MSYYGGWYPFPALTAARGGGKMGYLPIVFIESGSPAIPPGTVELVGVEKERGERNYMRLMVITKPQSIPVGIAREMRWEENRKIIEREQRVAAARGYKRKIEEVPPRPERDYMQAQAALTSSDWENGVGVPCVGAPRGVVPTCAEAASDFNWRGEWKGCLLCAHQLGDPLQCPLCHKLAPLVA